MSKQDVKHYLNFPWVKQLMENIHNATTPEELNKARDTYGGAFWSWIERNDGSDEKIKKRFRTHYGMI